MTIRNTMDDMLMHRAEARERGDHETADRLSREIERRAAEDEARHR